MYVCMYVCMYIYIHIHTHIHIYIYIIYIHITTELKDKGTELSLCCCYSEFHALCRLLNTTLFAGWLYSIEVLTMSCPLRNVLNSTCFHVATENKYYL